VEEKMEVGRAIAPHAGMSEDLLMPNPSRESDQSILQKVVRENKDSYA